MIPQTVYGLTPVSEEAKQWIDDNVASEPWQWLGRSLVIENRYLADIIEGMVNDGLQPNIDFEA